MRGTLARSTAERACDVAAPLLIRARKILSQAHDSEHEDDPDRDEDGLDDSSRDVADPERFVLPPRDRVEDDARPDVREDEEELEQDREVEPARAPVPPTNPAGSSRTGWKSASAPIDVMNVMMNSTPNIRPCL